MSDRLPDIASGTMLHFFSSTFGHSYIVNCKYSLTYIL